MLIIRLLLLVSAGSMLFGAETGKMFFTSVEECITARDGEFSVYSPHFDDNLKKWRTMKQEGKAEEITNHGKTYCAEEWSVDEKLIKGWRIVRWPKNNSYFRSADGKLADGRCGNTVRRLWEVPEPEPVIRPAKFELPPAPAPLQLNELPPAPPPFTEKRLTVSLVYDEGFDWGRFRPDRLCWRDGKSIPAKLVRGGLCAAAIVLPLTLGGGEVAAVFLPGKPGIPVLPGLL